MSPSSDIALEHLRSIKPNDGWSIEKKTTGGSNLVRLTRRNIPITESYFFDIHYDNSSITAQQQVVGILSNNTASTGGKVQAQVLVDRNGRPCGDKISIISVSGYPTTKTSTKPNMSSKSQTSRAATASSSGVQNDIFTTPLTDDQNRDLVMYGGGAVLLAILFRLILSSAASLSIIIVPLGYFYLVATCPTVESFETKRELKRILRGYHLPDDHPDKPKGILSETIARIQASVTTELATLPGYEVTIIPIAGAAHVVCVRVPSVQKDFYWIGAAKRWTYIYETSMKNDGNVR